MKNKTKHIRPKDAVKLHLELGYGFIGIATVRLWASKYKFGRKVGGKWFIDENKFIEFLNEG